MVTKPLFTPTFGLACRRIRPLASGGMASVELAARREGTFLRLYAIKRLHPHLRQDPEVHLMFLDEARIAGLIRHPSVVSVLDVGEDGEGPFLVMDFIEGVSAAAIAERAARTQQPVPLDVALRIGAEAADGLHAAHELLGIDGRSLKLVHRDISPQNILVGFDGVARVTDFGIARALGRMARTSTGILKGKLGYMSPEQLSFRDPDRRSDLFSLGVVLFELLASQRLYPSSGGEASARRILDEPPPDLAEFREDAPPELVALFFRLLAKQPEHRPPDASVVAQTLREVLAERASAGALVGTADYLQREFGDERRHAQDELARVLAAAEPDAAGVPARAHRRRRRLLRAGATVGALGLGLAGLRIFMPQATTAPAQPTPAAAVRRFEPVFPPPKPDGDALAGTPAQAQSPVPEAPKTLAPRPRATRGHAVGSGVKLWGWQ